MNDIEYQVWDLETRNMCDIFAHQESAITAAVELSRLNPGVEYCVFRVVTEDNAVVLEYAKDGQRILA